MKAFISSVAAIQETLSREEEAAQQDYICDVKVRSLCTPPTDVLRIHQVSGMLVGMFVCTNTTPLNDITSKLFKVFGNDAATSWRNSKCNGACQT